MKYTLQVLKGRSDVTALRLIDGVNSVGRHDDCVIRIRSSQVSRRHCEIFEADDRLVVRDLGSSNGTFVNGLRVLGQQPLKPGDVITIGGVALRVDPIGGHVPAAAAVVAPASGGDTTDADALIDDEVEIVDAIEIDEPDDFEISADVAEIEPDDFVLSDAIPLEEEPAPPPPPPAPVEGKKKKKKKAKEETVDASAEPEGEQDDAVAQFLMDLKLDEND
ncbi:FHA domain-containing protein [Paludisphaera rhizosphaerae]|uniref:FHA domain-containing protein n=1 Tax=Paludisphaera rhizosphaerae TaxID=2711216 RepID=UPI0013EAD4AF|nr:FHA domain-containing protein [Paludisphaera rhizosphaerae]